MRSKWPNRPKFDPISGKRPDGRLPARRDLIVICKTVPVPDKR